jgi:hypothetical protein
VQWRCSNSSQLANGCWLAGEITLKSYVYSSKPYLD